MEPPAEYVDHAVKEGNVRALSRDLEDEESEIDDRQGENQDSEAKDDGTPSGSKEVIFEGGSSKSSMVAPGAVAAAPPLSGGQPQFQQTKRRSSPHETAVATYGADLRYKDQVASVAAPGPVNAAARSETGGEAPLLEQKKRRSTPHEIAVATGGVGLDFKDQVAPEELAIQATRTRAAPTKADLDQDAAAANRRPFLPSRIGNGDEGFQTEDQSQLTRNVLIPAPTSSRSTTDNSSNIDNAGRIGNTIQANVAETDHELRQRMFQDAVSAEVVHVEPLNRRKWFGCGLLILLIAVVVVAVSVSTQAGNAGSSTASIGIVPSTPTASPTVTVSPTNAPSPRPPAELELQLVVGGSDTRNPDVVFDALHDGAVVYVDEVGTESFAIIAIAADVVEAVEFDTGERESTRPFSRCGDINARNLINACEDLVSPGTFTVWATPLGAKDEDGERIPWPTVTVTFELVGKLD